MKAGISLTLALGALTPLVSAWPNWLPHVDALVVRQNSEASGEVSATPTPTRGSTARTSATLTNSASEEASGTTTRRRATDLNTAKVPTGSESVTRTPDIDDTAPVGAATMITPAPTDPGLKLYKIGTNVTFGWNYTNVIVNPTAIDVLASCSAAARSWTLTSNMTWETQGSYVWDTQEQATDVQSPLLTEEYTLIIYDADTAITDTPRGGYLGVSDQFTFKMYKPQDYLPLNEWKCPTCSAAAPSYDSRVLSFALTMSAATVLSFTWFVAGFAL